MSLQIRTRQSSSLEKTGPWNNGKTYTQQMMQYYGQHLLQTVIKDTEYADRAMRVSLKFGTKTR